MYCIVCSRAVLPRLNICVPVSVFLTPGLVLKDHNVGLFEVYCQGPVLAVGLGVAVVPVGWMTAAPDHLRTAIA